MLTRYAKGSPIGARRSAPFNLPVTNTTTPPKEANQWWWHPSQPGVISGPDWFNKKLHAIDPDVQVTWNAYNQRWQVWLKRPQLVGPHCRGWRLLFVVKYADGSYAPLDERTLSKLYEISGDKWGNAKEYFIRLENELERDKEKMEAERTDSVKAGGREYFDYLQPKISMCGPSNGSKCVNNQ